MTETVKAVQGRWLLVDHRRLRR